MAHGGDGDPQMLTNELYSAIHRNNIEQVRCCIRRGVDLSRVSGFHLENLCNDNYACPLASACFCGHEEIIEELLEAGADCNQLSGSMSHWSVWNFAAINRRITLSMIQTLLSYGADPRLGFGCGNTLLHSLAYNNIEASMADSYALVPAAKLLLDNGVSFYDDDGNFTPLRCAIMTGNIDLVKLFIAEGADVNFGNGEMLRAATVSEKVDMLNLVLDAGANRYLNAEGLIDVLTSTSRHHDMIARIFETCVVDLYTADNENGMSPLHHVCQNGFIKSHTLQVLLDHGADVTAVSWSGDTVLHYAVETLDCRKIRPLLAYKPPINRKNNNRRTPLVQLLHQDFEADFPEKKLAFKMLVDAGANITVDFHRELNILHQRHPEIEISDYKTNCLRSLEETCRLVIRRSVPVPVDANLCRLPIPKQLQTYLNFPEFDPMLVEFKDIMSKA